MRHIPSAEPAAAADYFSFVGRSTFTIYLLPSADVNILESSAQG
jgi:hypothetical protein